MSSIESLKEQARRHEQKEEWQKALAQYQKAIDKLEEKEQPDIGLYNRVGDIQTRVGNVEAAVEAYEEAVDLYVEAELPNNAIAVCKKIIRNMPMRNQAYLRMGQIRAEQGFLVDARQNFLTYAERMQASGEIDEALRALVEFADLAPDDLEIRLALANQFAQHDREEEAKQQLAIGYRTAEEAGNQELASTFEAQLREIDPTADLDALAAAAPVGARQEEPEEEELAFETTSLSSDEEIGGEFGEISLGDDDEDEEADEAEEAVPAEVEADFSDFGEITFGDEDEDEEEEPAAEAMEGAVEDFGFEMGDEEAEDEAEPAEVEDEFGDFGELDDFGDEEDEDEDQEPLPTFGYEDEDEAEAEEDDGEPLPTFGFDDEDDEDDEDDDDDEDEEAEEEWEDEEDEDQEPLPTFSWDEEEAEEEAEEAEEADEEVLDAAAFGEADRGEKETREYVEGGGEMGELDVGGLELTGFDEEEEPAAEPPAASAEAMEEAVEEAVSEERVEEEAVEEEPVAAEAPMEEARELDEGLEGTRARIEEDPDAIQPRQRLVELAFQENDDELLVDAYLGLADTLAHTGQETRAQAVYQQVLSVDPDNEVAREALGRKSDRSAPVREVASSEDYVDLGSMILDDEEEEKTTRFTVAYEEPSGDEQADFAKMLDQFKAKIAENVSADDVKAHHDLGTAYKEMGLLDEAIEEFQQALRASADHLPTYELLGQVFMEKGEHEAAVRSLSRALEASYDVEDELLGIYYYLGRAHEELGNTDSAKEFYDRVFSLDINFADVTERLRALR